MKNSIVDQAVFLNRVRSMYMAIHQCLHKKLNQSANWAVNRAAYRAVYDAGAGAVIVAANEAPPHPGLEPYLAGVAR